MKSLKCSLKMKFIKIVLLLLLVFFVSPNAQAEDKKFTNEILTPVVAYSKVDKVKGVIGDTITLEVSIDQAKEVKVDLPDLKKSLEDFEIVQEEKQEPQLVDNRLEKKLIYKLQVKNVGAYSIPAIKIKYHVPKDEQEKYGKDGEVKTSKIFLDIQSVLTPEDKKKDIEDIKPIEEIAVLDPNTVFLIAIFGILLLVGIYFFIRKNMKPKPPIPAHEIAFKELEKIKTNELEKKEDLKIYYFKISELVRVYIKHRFAIDALEKEYTDIESDLLANKDLNKTHLEFIKEFMSTTDFYKFTDYKSEKSKAVEIFENTYKFIDQTKEELEKKK